MNQGQLKEASEALLALKANLQQRIVRTSRALADDDRPKGEDMMPHRALQSVAVAENAVAAGELREVEAALQRLQSGGFGICENCEEEISEGRLKHRPQARYCTGCQEAAERRQGILRDRVREAG